MLFTQSNQIAIYRYYLGGSKLHQEDIMKKAYMDLSKSFLLDTYRNNKNKNIVISPYSLYIFFVMIFNMTSGKTRQELAEILCVGEDIDEFLALAKKTHKDLSNVRYGAKMCSSNGIIVSNDFLNSINKKCMARLTRLLDVELISGDDDIVDKVNSWVSKNTNEMINIIISELPENFKALVLNAISFDGAWINQYYGDSIKKNVKFNNADGTTSNVTMLNQMINKYIEDEYYTGIRKGYSGGKYSFIALLPKEKNNEPITEEAVRQMDFVQYMTDKKGWYIVDSEIPEFSCETSMVLNNYCENIGIKDLFSTKSDFSCFTKIKDFFIDTVFQKAVIDVNRDGTRAGAISGGALYGDGFSPINIIEKQVHLNRPFVYAIIENYSCLPIFMGAVNKL